MDKKFIFIAAGGLLIVTILIIVLVVVGKKPNTGTTAKSNVLVVWDYHDRKAAYDPIITSFQQERKIKVQYVSKNPDSYLEDTVSAIAAGNGPDVWIVPANILPKYKDKLVYMPPNGFADASNKKDDIEGYAGVYPPVVIQDNVFDGHIYGAPMSIDYLKLYVNNDLINKAINDYWKTNPKISIDQLSKELFSLGNWDNLVNTVRFYTKKSGSNVSRSAIALGTSSNIDTADSLLTLLMLQNGAVMTSSDLSTAQLHTKQNLFGDVDYPGTKALEFYTSFANATSPNYTWNKSMPNAIRAFAEGKVAMLIDYESAEKEIKNITPNLNYQVVDIPQIKETKNPVNIAKYDTIVVTKSAKDPLTSWRFIKKCIDPQYTNSYLFYTGEKAVIQNNKDQVKILKSWFNPDPIKVENIFKDIITQVNGGNDPQTAMDGAGGQITTLLEKIKQ